VIVLVAPPYLRLVGSHNDRIPLELAYLQRYLRSASHSTTLLNADATGATVYLSWRRLFANHRYLAAAVRDGSPLFDETIERIMSFSPTVAVVAAADAVTPWVDLGNPYVSAAIASRLRGYGIYTVGVGPFFARIPTRFLESFDAILVGQASPTIAEVVDRMPTGVISGRPHNPLVLPDLDSVPAHGRDDVVMTALGCPLSCRFCFAAQSPYRALPLPTVVSDIHARRSTMLDIGDSILPLGRERLQELARDLGEHSYEFSCEVSVRTCTELNLQALWNLGVRSVKLGVESASARQLSAWNKRQTVNEARDAVKRIRELGFHLTIYVLLGGPGSSIEDAHATLDLCSNLSADDYVVNVYAFHDLETRDFRFDAHFSQTLVNEYHLEPIMNSFFALQADRKRGLGQLLRDPEAPLTTGGYVNGFEEVPGGSYRATV
jgi:radical SAM superfamily enzyme YgiQ (UPF0313 family)